MAPEPLPDRQGLLLCPEASTRQRSSDTDSPPSLVDMLIRNLVSECQLLSVLLYILDIDEGTRGDGVYAAK